MSLSPSTAAAITEELWKLTEEKLELSGVRGFDSPFYHTTETLTGCQTRDKTRSSTQPGGTVRDTHHAVSTPDKAENTVCSSTVGSERGAGAGEGGIQLLAWSSHAPFTHVLLLLSTTCTKAPLSRMMK